MRTVEFVELTHEDGARTRLQVYTRLGYAALSEKGAAKAGFSLLDDGTWGREASDDVIKLEIARSLWVSPVCAWRRVSEEEIAATMQARKATAPTPPQRTAAMAPAAALVAPDPRLASQLGELMAIVEAQAAQIRAAQEAISILTRAIETAANVP